MQQTKSTEDFPYPTLEQSPIASVSTKVPLSESSLDPSETKDVKDANSQTSPSLIETSKKPDHKNDSELNFHKTIIRAPARCPSKTNGRKMAKIICGYKRTKRPEVKLDKTELLELSQNEKPSPKSEIKLSQETSPPQDKLTEISNRNQRLIEGEDKIFCFKPSPVKYKSRGPTTTYMISFSSRRKTLEFVYYEREEKRVRFSYQVQNRLHRHTNDDDCDTDDEQIKQAIKVCTRDLVQAIKAAISEVKPPSTAIKKVLNLSAMVTIQRRPIKKDVA